MNLYWAPMSHHLVLGSRETQLAAGKNSVGWTQIIGKTKTHTVHISSVFVDFLNFVVLRKGA